MIKELFLLICVLPFLALAQNGQTWYDYYATGGRTSGLVPAQKDYFELNGKPFRIVSGAVHYFRVHPQYWRDRLRKLRAVGANTVETYMPWNLHEPRRGEYDFGEGQNDMSAFLNVTAFVEMARQEDLFVILRPGPFICSEWDFGGLPSWLLRDAEMKVRSSYKGFTDVADAYFAEVFKRVVGLQFQKGDGPIIAFQVENEFGAFGYGDEPRDTEYMIHLRDKMVELGATEMFFTSDTPTRFGDMGAVPGELQTANFQRGADEQFDALDVLQPGKPYMATEFWTGWFDHWGQGFHDEGSDLAEFSFELERILTRNGSVNFYMFIGGTDFSFMNGANDLPVFPNYVPDVSSYDYDAPLTEAGDYSEKYYIAKDLIARFSMIPNIYMPDMPPETVKTAYPAIRATEHLTIYDLLPQVPAELVIESDVPLAMEDLPINNNNGQSYGFIMYRHQAAFADGSHTIKTVGHVRDIAIFLLDGERLSAAWQSDVQLPGFGYWAFPNRTLDFTTDKGNANYNVDLLVENAGRNNFGNPSDFDQKRGLPEGPVLLDNQEATGWTIYPLEFKSAWVRGLTNWNTNAAACNCPTLTKAVLSISGEPTDTFISSANWGSSNRGVVFVNGFNIGRFSGVGPTVTLYVPAPILKQGDNTILVWSLFGPAVTDITFTAKPELGPSVRGDTTTTTPASVLIN